MAYNPVALRNTVFTILAVFIICLGFMQISAIQDRSDVIRLHGACIFDDEHSYTKALVKFSELVQEYYQGPKRLEFILHKNSELGQEKDYFNYMNIGAVVEFAIASPSHASTFSRMVTIMDVPFLFRDTDHYLKTMDSGIFERVETAVSERADVLILGYGGGEKRHLVGRKPIRNLAELKGFYMRVMGSPIQSRMFEAVGATPTVISGAEVYNAIQTGVIEGAENSASAIEKYKWFEVADQVSLAAVSIIIRPLFFNGKRFRKLPMDLQEAIRKAGKEAMEFERNYEIAIDDPLMEQLVEEGKVSTHQFEEREKLLELAAPVKRAYAEEIGALDILEAINAIE
ncbi:MAG: TRAP transporter substrate-binding protein [Saprospiraceae bacterium]|nr:TRAP transporter substrate-binding protein [Saprospiraceae bacterium]